MFAYWALSIWWKLTILLLITFHRYTCQNVRTGESEMRRRRLNKVGISHFLEDLSLTQTHSRQTVCYSLASELLCEHGNDRFNPSPPHPPLTLVFFSLSPSLSSPHSPSPFPLALAPSRPAIPPPHTHTHTHMLRGNGRQARDSLGIRPPGRSLGGRVRGRESAAAAGMSRAATAVCSCVCVCVWVHVCVGVLANACWSQRQGTAPFRK